MFSKDLKDNLFNLFGEYFKQDGITKDNFKELVKVTNITDDLKLAKEIIEGYVNKDAEKNKEG